MIISNFTDTRSLKLLLIFIITLNSKQMEIEGSNMIPVAAS